MHEEVEAELENLLQDRWAECGPSIVGSKLMQVHAT